MPPRSLEQRAAVLADLALGTPLRQVARAHGLPTSTVRSWRARAAAPPKKALIDVGGLVLDYLAEALTTLSVQARHFRDPAWLQGQPADSVAVLHGVLADKATRILAALEAGREAARTDATAAGDALEAAPDAAPPAG